STIIKNDKLAPCLVIFCSSLGGLASLQSFLDFLNATMRERRRELIFIKDKHGRDLQELPHAKGIFRDLESNWFEYFPKFSTEPRVDSTIQEWLRYFRSLGVTKESDFCEHNHIE